MKNKWQEFRVTLLFCLLIGWWGFWYPELEIVADTYAIVLEDGTVQKSSEVIKCEFNGNTYLKLSDVDDSQIKVRSKLWKLLQEYFEEDWSEE